jgi:hypothetical protein
MKVWMDDLGQRFTKTLESHSREVQNRLSDIECSSTLVNSIADKLSERRQQQIQLLRQRTRDMQTSHPVAKLLGRCVVDLVSAADLSQPDALLQSLTALYNEAHRDQTVSPPVWNQELSGIVGLALGYSDSHDASLSSTGK